LSARNNLVAVARGHRDDDLRVAVGYVWWDQVIDLIRRNKKEWRGRIVDSHGCAEQRGRQLLPRRRRLNSGGELSSEGGHD
jgi:hypothetical protein